MESLTIGQLAQRAGVGVETVRSTITCPQCGHSKEETMPTNACMFFYVRVLWLAIEAEAR